MTCYSQAVEVNGAGATAERIVFAVPTILVKNNNKFER
jgi:hypothetical protein